MSETEPTPKSGVRLDLFLDVACLFPTRSKAKTAIEAGRVEVNGEPARPHRLVRVGDALAIRAPGRVRTFVVRGLADKHVAKADARKLYEETTPEPSPEEIAMRRFLRQTAEQRDEGAGRPTKRERRQLEDRKRPRGA
jgi:ribosome-associated heat shock protein Hsp15